MTQGMKSEQINDTKNDEKSHKTSLVRLAII